MIELYISTVKILAQRPTHISDVATVLLMRERGRERGGERESVGVGGWGGGEREREID